MRPIARTGAGLLLVLLALWFVRGLQLRLAAAPVGLVDLVGPGGATPLIQPPAGSPTCRTTEPPTSSPYLSVAHADAVHYGVDPLVFTWQIWFESTYNPNALSAAGAEGIAQFLPGTAHGYGIDPWNPTQALDAAARDDAGHLLQFASLAQQLAAHYGGNEPRYDYGLALSAYNAGPGATTGAWKRAYAGGTVWPASGPWAWLALLAGETQRYIQRILGCW